MTKLVDTDRLFSNVLPHVGNKKRIVDELIENSVRAGARNIDVTLNEQGVLTCSDDGKGISDWCSLIKVASTGHSDFVSANENPAGMGMMMLIAASHTVEISSGMSTLFIERAQFFNLPEYRDELIKKAESLNESASQGDGCVVKLSLTSGMQKGVAQMFEAGKQSRYSYYSACISINGVPVKNKVVDWITCREGEGDIAGARIGLAHNLSGMIIWHGKLIECSALKPFVVEVHSKTPVLCPALPDRERIDNNDDALSKLHDVIEEQLSDAIQCVFNKSEGKDMLEALSHLNCQYDVSHWRYWGRVCDYLYGELYVRIVSVDDFDVFYSCSDASLVLDGDSFYVDFYDMGECAKLISESINATPMPGAFRAKFTDKLEFTVKRKSKSDQTYDFGGRDLELVDSIMLNGVERHVFLVDDDGCFWVSDLEDFFDFPASQVAYCEEVSLGEFERVCESLRAAVYGTANYHASREFVCEVMAAAGFAGLAAKSVTIDLESDEVEVVTKCGKKKTLSRG